MDHETHDRIRRWVRLPRPAAEVWDRIGAFGALADWHPMVATAEVVDIEGEAHRHVTMTDGGRSIERLADAGPSRYAYEIVDGPFPIAEARGVLSAVPEEDGCHVFWSMDFAADDPAADDVVAGFIEAGLRALRERFGG